MIEIFEVGREFNSKVHILIFVLVQCESCITGEGEMSF